MGTFTGQYSGSERSKGWGGLSGREFSIVVPILNPNLAESLVRLAVALAGVHTPTGEAEKLRVRVVILGIVTVPEETPLSQGASLVKAYRTLLRYIPPDSSRLSERVEVRTEVRVAREVWQGIADQVREEQADLLLLYWRGSTETPSKIYGATIDALMEDPPCDVILARFNSLPEIKNILLPVRGSSYNHLASRLVSNLAEQWGANVTVMHNFAQNIPPAADSGYSGGTTSLFGEDEISAFQSILSELPPGARLLTTRGNPAQAIAREAKYHDLLVLGASGRVEGQTEFETTGVTQYLADEINGPLLIVRTRKPLRFAPSRPASNDEDELVETVDRWFAQNTFHYREFRSLSSLTLLKERNNLSISLVFPIYGPTHPLTLAETVRRTRYALMRDCGLIDEIVVSAPGVRLDSAEIKLFKSETEANNDESAEEDIIFLGPEGLEEGHRADGPGEALWQALQVTRGDIIIWADPRVAGFEARLFYGLAGPLLTYPEFQLAIGFYSKHGGEDPANSEPVKNELVELSMRPLLGGLFPLLAGVIDPSLTLGAARREHLEHLPFFTSAAFTGGLLIDTLPRAGLMSIAQVDLGSPPHLDSPPNPQRRVADLLEVILRRAGERSQSSLLKLYSPGVKTVRKINGVYSMYVEAAASLQREITPLAYTPGYHRRSF